MFSVELISAVVIIYSVDCVVEYADGKIVVVADNGIRDGEDGL